MEKKKLFSKIGRIQWYCTIISMVLVFLPQWSLLILTTILPVFFYVHLQKQVDGNINYVKEKGKLSVKELAYWICVILGACYAVNIITTVVIDVLGYTPIGNIQEGTLLQLPIIYLFTTCILGPICEEVIFRGAILHSLLPYGRWFACVCSAMFFSFLHGNVLAMPSTFCMGILSAWLVLKHGNIKPTIVLHIIYNTIAMLGSLGFSDLWLVASNIGIVCLMVFAASKIRLLPVFWAWLSEDKLEKEHIASFLFRPANFSIMFLMLYIALSEIFIGTYF